MAVPWLRLLVANLLTWRPQESPCGFVVDKLSLEQGLFRYFGYPVPLSYQQCSILTHLSISNTWQLRASLNNIIKKLITYQLVWRCVAWPSLTSTVCLTLLGLLHKKITSVHFFGMFLEQFSYRYTDFHGIWYLFIFWKTVKKNEVLLKPDKNNR